MDFRPFFTSARPLRPGEPAPTPTAIDQDGAVVDFAAIYRRGLTLVYFYPKADTPGCTAQGCALRDAMADLAGAGLEIVGVSGDRPEAQRRFRDRYRLPYRLVADSSGEVARAFGVPTVLGFPKRQSFLVRAGTVVWVALRARTSGHAEEVREAMKGLALSGGHPEQGTGSGV